MAEDDKTFSKELKHKERWLVCEQTVGYYGYYGFCRIENRISFFQDTQHALSMEQPTPP